ncbi:MAG TPA: extracellular solute-binding protein, partial [bacterium]|nr:extracellular solute-binding protein [bacterium]
SMIDVFEDANPNIIVKYEVITNSLSENILGSFGAGVAPDIFYLDSVWAPIFMEKGVLYPVDNLTSQAVIDEYYPSLLVPFTGSDGKVYGLPKDWSMLSLYYNKDMLSSGGAECTPVPDTWDALEACAKAIRTATGKPGLAMGQDLNRAVPMITSNGGPAPWFTSAADASYFDDATVVSSLTSYMELFTEGVAEIITDKWFVEAFGLEEVGMVISGNWAIPNLPNAGDPDKFPNMVYDTDWGIAPVPKGSSGRSTMAYTVALGINADTDNPEEAWKFVEYLLGQDGQTELVVKKGNALPSIEGLDTHADMWPQHKETLSHTYDTTTVFVWGPKSSIDGDIAALMISAEKGDITIAEALVQMKAVVVAAFA